MYPNFENKSTAYISAGQKIADKFANSAAKLEQEENNSEAISRHNYFCKKL